MKSPIDASVFPIDALGSIGFIAPDDQRDYETPPNAINSIENMRVHNGSLVPMNSLTGIVIEWWAENQITDNGRISELDYVTNASGTYWLWFQEKNILSVDHSGVPQESWESPFFAQAINASPYTGTWPDNIWEVDKLNGILFATNGVDAPQVNYELGGAPTTSTTPMIPFPNFPSGAKAKLAISYKNFVVLFNVIDENGIHYPNAAWWSHPADPGLFPGDGPEASYGWDVANPESLSGRVEMGRDSGAIICARVMRDAIFVYCEFAVYRMTLQRSLDVFTIKEVYSNIGVFGPRSVTEFHGRHFVIGKDDIYVNDGQQLASIGDARVRRYLHDNLSIDDTNKLRVCVRRDIDEIWVLRRQTKTDDLRPANDRALVWHLHDNIWTECSLLLSGGGYPQPVSASMVGFKEMPRLDEVVDSDAGISYDAADFTYDSDIAAEMSYGTTVQQIGQFDYFAFGFADNGSGGWDNNQYQLEAFSTGNSVVPVNIEFSLMGVNLSDDESNQLVTGIYPKADSDSDSEIDIYVASRLTASGEDTWQGPFTFNPRTDFYIPCRVRGRRHSFRLVVKTRQLEGEIDPPIWEIPNVKIRGIDVKFVEVGRRA